VDLFLAISQGVGVSVATGIRAFLPPLLVGALARADAGANFTGTGYGFLESIPWLAALLVATAVVTLAERSRAVIPALLLGGAALGIGAVEFAGSLAEEGYSAAPGFPAGAACAALAFVAARLFFGRAAARVRGEGQEEAASLLDLIAQGAAILLAVLALFVSPVSWLAFALCAWIVLVQRRRSGQKYEGLRILR
jgi:hypothetical protein